MRRAQAFTMIIGLAISVLAVFGFVQNRRLACEPLPLLTQNLLPHANLAPNPLGLPLPDGWAAAAPGALLRGPAIGAGEGFDTDGDGRAIQLIGIANTLQTPTVSVRPGTTYCFTARVLTDSPLSSTRVQLTFSWNPRPLDQPLTSPKPDDAEPSFIYQTDWQPVVQWTPATRDWSRVVAAFTAPPGATTLAVQIRPASDDRIYLDAPRLLEGGNSGVPITPAPTAPLHILPWPNGARGALSFSFDWETTMGGLIHSRSVDDPHADQDPVARGLRMREGVTTTLRLFAPYQIRATYFSNGYNFLLGNRERRTFMGDPVFRWANTEKPHLWRTDVWTRVPWFAPDPYSTAQQEPAWYFGDLVPIVRAARQDVQSHTFSHLYAGFAAPNELSADAAEWKQIAAEVQVPSAVALAFPWSGSAGMSDASWQVLADAGITTVTRTNRSQRQYMLVRAEDVTCRYVPGHATILACPDFYLTTETADQAIALIDRAIEREGMIDLWAHTEEVTSAAQIAAWGKVVAHAGNRQSDGTLWIAPLREIADWQRARDQLRIMQVQNEPLTIRIQNPSTQDLDGLTLEVPVSAASWEIDGIPQTENRLVLNIRAGQTVEVKALKR